MARRLKITNNTMNNKTELVIGLLQMGALWVFLAFLVKDYALDRLRQNLFRIRGELFDKVITEGGSFEEPTYLHLRGFINQIIRRGHMVTISRSILANVLSYAPFITGGVSAREMREDVEQRIKEIDELESKNETVKDVRARVHSQLLQYYALTSPIFITAMAVAIVLVICATGVIGVRAVAKMAFDKFLARDIERGIIVDGCGGQPA